LENTPKGVTIHAIDEGIDTGDILVQREVLFGDGETLASTYVRLNHEMCDLFVHSWAGLRSGQIKGVPQLPAQGSLHKLRDRDRFAHLLQRGWDTPVSELIGKAL
jgi:methionyl-tRNA formyltransferase